MGPWQLLAASSSEECCARHGEAVHREQYWWMIDEDATPRPHPHPLPSLNEYLRTASARVPARAPTSTHQHAKAPPAALAQLVAASVDAVVVARRKVDLTVRPHMSLWQGRALTRYSGIAVGGGRMPRQARGHTYTPTFDSRVSTTPCEPPSPSPALRLLSLFLLLTSTRSGQIVL